MQGCVSAALLQSRWDKEDTSSSGSSVLWLLLPRPIHLPVVTLASGFLPILLPSCPPSKHTHSLIPSLPSLTHSLLPSLATREVCGTEASIIDRASVYTWCRICGMWASSWGFEQGRHYVILHILICLVHLCACPFHRHTLPQTLGNTNTCHRHPRNDYCRLRLTWECEKAMLLPYENGFNHLWTVC